MNSIRCLECGSIDPITYSNRTICCLPPEELTTVRPGDRQYQFSSLTGNIGLFCIRGCCDFSKKHERHFCLRWYLLLLRTCHPTNSKTVAFGGRGEEDRIRVSRSEAGRFFLFRGCETDGGCGSLYRPITIPLSLWLTKRPVAVLRDPRRKLLEL